MAAYGDADERAGAGQMGRRSEYRCSNSRSSESMGGVGGDVFAGMVRGPRPPRFTNHGSLEGGRFGF